MICSKCHGKGVIHLKGKTLEERLLFLRELNGLSLRELEEKTGISYQKLNRIERDVSPLGAKNLKILSDFYKVDISELMA